MTRQPYLEAAPGGYHAPEPGTFCGILDVRPDADGSRVGDTRAHRIIGVRLLPHQREALAYWMVPGEDYVITRTAHGGWQLRGQSTVGDGLAYLVDARGMPIQVLPTDAGERLLVAGTAYVARFDRGQWELWTDKE